MTNKISCIIVDDELKAIEFLKECLKTLYSNIEVIASYTSPAPALNALRNTPCDLVFMDISISGSNGLELLKLAPGINAEVIFITAYSEYAVEAFQLSASGYLLKPVDAADMVAAVDKAIERIRYKKLAKQNIEMAPRHKIGIPNNKGIDYVEMDEILYFESVNKYTNVVMKDKEILSSYNLGRYKALTEGQLFYQVHRSYIVNLNYIHRYESTGVLIMSNRKEVPIAKNEKENFFGIFSIVARQSKDGI